MCVCDVSVFAMCVILTSSTKSIILYTLSSTYKIIMSMHTQVIMSYLHNNNII